MTPKQFKIEVVKESALSAIFLGSAKLPKEKMEEVMNNHGRDGWDLAFINIERHRTLLFWSREAAVITFSRPLT